MNIERNFMPTPDEMIDHWGNAVDNMRSLERDELLVTIQSARQELDAVNYRRCTPTLHEIAPWKDACGKSFAPGVEGDKAAQTWFYIVETMVAWEALKTRRNAVPA